MKKTLKLFITFIIIGITQVSCVKEDLKCPDEVPFCQLISQGEFNQTGDIFNSYFSKQNKNLSDLEKLEQLSDWLECKTCVAKVEIFCNSCILTLPAQSELNITFTINGNPVEKTLDILMSNPLKFAGFHE